VAGEEDWQGFYSAESRSGSGRIEFQVNDKDPDRAVRVAMPSAFGGESLCREDVLAMAREIEKLQQELTTARQHLAVIQVLAEQAL
jgi:hypothetical protein